MILKQLLEDVDYTFIKGNLNLDINKIQYDSRKIQTNDVFFCITGFATDGHKFIKSALKNGASVIICEKNEDLITDDCTVIKVQDCRKALAKAASNFYENPSSKLKLIGITGTNGKTTSSFMIKKILEEAGHKVGLIGTIANFIGNQKLHTERTTPESLELHELFKKMVDAGVDYCVMEVSSHSLSLNRVYGLKFSQAIFTNLTRDHLDFHKTFENYYNAKLKLFLNSDNSIINIDDEYGEKLIKDVKNNILTYSINKKSDVYAKDISIHSRGAEFKVICNDIKSDIEIEIPGSYNIYNALGCFAACINEGIDVKFIKSALKKVQVPGRCELVSKNYNLDFDIIIDYAHSPDSLEKILKTTREFTKNRLISVFGCGGDRDKTKRPIMGKIGTDLSDIAFITSDNPRTEEPMDIINDILKGVETKNYKVVCSRKEAIKEAIKTAKKGDVIVIAGKGHEDYQVLKDKTIHFDEREIVSDIVRECF